MLPMGRIERSQFGSETDNPGATHAVSRRPLSSASRPFMRPILKVALRSKWPVRETVGEQPLFSAKPPTGVNALPLFRRTSQINWMKMQSAQR
jgi:hypothetical protein